MHLYEITDEYLKTLAGDEDGVIDIEALDKIQGQLEDKAIAIASLVRNLEAEYAMITDAEQRMDIRKRKIQKKADSLEEYLRNHLLMSGIDKITKSPHFVIGLRKCPPSVVIVDEKQIPGEFIKTKQVTSIDKVAIKKAWDADKPVEGTAIKQNMNLFID